MLEKAVLESSSFMEVCRKIGKPNSWATVKKYVKMYSINTDHFKGARWNKNLPVKKDVRLKKGTVLSSVRGLMYLIPERGHRCECCGRETWNGVPIPLELHHKDGDGLNNDRTNLQILCPNCHALTSNYRGRNLSRTNQIKDEDFVSVLKKSKNIRQALLALGLSPKGDNYRRARELAFKYNIKHILEH